MNSSQLINQSSGDRHYPTPIDNLKALFTQRDWQPISTAPKDTKFLCALKTDYGYDIGVAELTSTGAVQSTDDSEPYFCRGYYCEATHWAPLPEPPQEEGK